MSDHAIYPINSVDPADAVVTDFEILAEKALSRRMFLGAGLAFGAQSLRPATC